MQDVKWIKIVVDMFEDIKIRQIAAMPEGDTYIVIWLRLLLLAGKINDGGCLILPGTDGIRYDDDMLAVEFGKSREKICQAMSIFLRFGMVEANEYGYIIHNWRKHQAGLEDIAKQQEMNRERVRKCRDRKRHVFAPAPTGSDTDDGSNAFGLDTDEAWRIQQEQDEVLDLAEKAGLATTDWDRSRLIELYSAHGKEKVLYAINEAAKQKKLSFAYIEKIIRNYDTQAKADENSLESRGLEDWDK